MPHTLFQLLAGIAGDLASFASHGSALVEAFRSTRFAYLSDRGFGQGVQSQFDVRHVVAEVFLFQPFVMLVLPGRFTAPTLRDDVGKGGVLLPFSYSGTVPFVSKFLTHFDATEPLVNPFVTVAQATVVGIRLLEVQFRVLHLVDAQGRNRSHPLLKRLGLGRRDGLNQAESCSVSATSVRRILPSAARIFKPLQFVTVSLPSFFNRFLRTRQYV